MYYLDEELIILDHPDNGIWIKCQWVSNGKQYWHWYTQIKTYPLF